MHNLIPYWKLKIISIASNGYKYCRINNKYFRFHRIVYFAYNPDWNIYDSSSDNIIDHIDRNPSNNHISNLRLGNQTLNNFNKESGDNAKGYSITTGGRFQVQFRGKYYGTYDTEEEAHQKYLDVKNEYFKLNNIII